MLKHSPRRSNHRRMQACGVLLCALSLWGCVAEPDEPNLETSRSNLTVSERVDRSTVIRETLIANGLLNPLLIAGIANAETGLAHCWSEATWACQGPNSVDCGGGPVIAGAGDGPCSLQQGGLGMFQFDAGTFEDTLAREGDRVLTLQGNIEAAIDFVLDMIKRSQYIEGVDTDAEAIAWMNTVRPWNDGFDIWIQTVTHYYNGCSPSCSVYASRIESYTSAGVDLMNEQGVSFWYGDDPICGEILPEGGVIDESSLCFGAGGNPDFWRTETDGHGGLLLWTNATDWSDVSNHAIWSLHFQEAGLYKVEVYTDSSWAESQQVAYQITHAGQTTLSVLDQSAADGFQSLGSFEFAAGSEQHIRLNDNTGESGSLARAIVADAVRLTRLDPNNPPIDDPPVDDPPVDDPPIDDPPVDDPPVDDPPVDDPPVDDPPVDDPPGGTTADSSNTTPDPMALNNIDDPSNASETSCGCDISTTPTNSSAPLWFTAMMAGVLLARRRRRP